MAAMIPRATQNTRVRYNAVGDSMLAAAPMPVSLARRYGSASDDTTE
jgi:hypothetical protein